MKELSEFAKTQPFDLLKIAEASLQAKVSFEKWQKEIDIELKFKDLARI